MSENHREPEVPEAGVPVVERLDGLARITLEELAITHFVKNGTLQNACSTRPRAVVGLGKSAHSHIVRLMNSRQKGLKRMMAKSAVAVLKKGNWQERETVTDECHDRTGQPGKRGDKKLGQNSSKRQSSDARQLGCVFQDMTPPKSILRKGTDMPKPIQRVKFTKAIARHTKIRDQNPSLGYICPGEPHQRSPNAPKFEDRSQEETEWQEQGAREAAWKLAKSVLKLKEHQRATFCSSENVKSTSPVTENHYKNGYVNYKNFIMTNEDNNLDTKYTNKNDTNNHDTRSARVSTAARRQLCFLSR